MEKNETVPDAGPEKESEEPAVLSPEERSARSLEKIKDAVYIFLFVTLIGQCMSSVPGKDKEADAMSDVARGMNAIASSVSELKDVIRYKSCD
jgi:hypothetical protein